MDAPTGTIVMPSTDLVGYGKWGELTYQQLWDQEPGYCLWTVNKFQELVKDGEELGTQYVLGDSAMKRLAQWITEVDAKRAAVEPQFECDSDMELVEVPNPQGETLAKRVALLRAESQSKFYGVAAPEDHAGIYTSWIECKPHVVGIKGVMYKSFASEEEALDYVQNPPPKKTETPEAIAAREQAAKAKEEAKAAKVAEAKAAREAKEAEKAARAAESKVAKEEAKAIAKSAKEAGKTAEVKAKEEAKAAKAAEASQKREAVITEVPEPKRGRKTAAADAGAEQKPDTKASSGTAAPAAKKREADTTEVPKPKRGRKPAVADAGTDQTPDIKASAQTAAPAAEKPVMFEGSSRSLKSLKKAKFAQNVKAKAKAKSKAKAVAKSKAAAAKAKTASAAKATPEAAAGEASKADQKAKADKEEAKAAKVAEAKAAREAKEAEKAAKAAEAKTAKEEAKAAKAKAAEDAKAADSTSSSAIPEEVLKRAEELGMAAALRNLGARAEIAEKGFSSEALLQTLVKAEGLVNKAKTLLLSPDFSPEDASPVSTSKIGLVLSPEKTLQERAQDNEANEELAKMLQGLSATLRLVSTPLKSMAAKDDAHVKTDGQSSLTEAQMQRMKENRERALARKAQAQAGN